MNPRSNPNQQIFLKVKTIIPTCFLHRYFFELMRNAHNIFFPFSFHNAPNGIGCTGAYMYTMHGYFLKIISTCYNVFYCIVWCVIFIIAPIHFTTTNALVIQKYYKPHTLFWKLPFLGVLYILKRTKKYIKNAHM